MDDLHIGIDKYFCPYCGLVLTEFMSDRSWLLEFEVMLSRSDDPLLKDIENRSLADQYGIYLHLMRKNGHV